MPNYSCVSRAITVRMTKLKKSKDDPDIDPVRRALEVWASCEPVIVTADDPAMSNALAVLRQFATPPKILSEEANARMLDAAAEIAEYVWRHRDESEG